jgi:hypothetical protein
MIHANMAVGRAGCEWAVHLRSSAPGLLTSVMWYRDIVRACTEHPSTGRFVVVANLLVWFEREEDAVWFRMAHPGWCSEGAD